MIPSKYSFENVFLGEKLNILQDKLEHQNSWNLLDKRPILLRYILFVVILIYFGGQNI
jgi:hypothetical protein